MKYCKNCGREIPDDASFCIYCMHELNEREQFAFPQFASIPRKRKTVIGICITAALLVVLAVVFILGNHVLHQASLGKSDYFDTVDYLNNKDTAKYWTTDGKPIENTVEQGGWILELKERNDTYITFTLTNYQSNAYREAQIEISCPLDRGLGRFSFEDDGWGNAGTGKIEDLIESHGCIWLDLTITQQNDSANWAIAFGNPGSYFYEAGTKRDVRD